jgi:hypothetical protein
MMASSTVSSSIDNYQERHRLENLLPTDWNEKISICSSSGKKSWLGDRTQPLITTNKMADRSFSIAINFRWWQQLDEDVRNLLWWHELARIQRHSVVDDRTAVIIGIAGLSMATGQLISQDIVMLAIGSIVAGLAGFQLYQSRRGEQYLRHLTQADRGAIALAEQFGYSPTAAYENLHSALKMLTAKVTSGQLAKVYRTRLQVLEICGQFAKS